MEENKRYRWVTHGYKNCERCAELDGKEMNFSEWFGTVLPGIHDGCDCSLESVDDDSEVEPGLVFGQLKSRRGPFTRSKFGIDHRISGSHKSLKPKIAWKKILLPYSCKRPLNIAHYGG
jgi:hypothetical protein